MFGATLDIPAFTRGHDQLSPADVEATRKLANVRIHVERIIGSVHQRYQILSATGVLTKELVSCKTRSGCIILDSVVRVCCSLNNVVEGVVPFIYLFNLYTIHAYHSLFINLYSSKQNNYKNNYILFHIYTHH